ncbi:hypothetical protein KKE60_08540 [Patescibacteria group bacterium]|nr:hypothetical protein [Patescibacteria group bacterium]
MDEEESRPLNVHEFADLAEEFAVRMIFSDAFMDGKLYNSDIGRGKGILAGYLLANNIVPTPLAIVTFLQLVGLAAMKLNVKEEIPIEWKIKHTKNLQALAEEDLPGQECMN